MILDQFQIGPGAFAENNHLLEQPLVVDGVAADGYAADEDVLQDVLIIHLCCGYIELTRQAGQYGLYFPTFFFE